MSSGFASDRSFRHRDLFRRKGPIDPGGLPPVVLGRAVGIGHVFASAGNNAQGLALTHVFLALGGSAVMTAQHQVIALSDACHRVLVVFCETAGPTGHMVVENAFGLPFDWLFTLQQGAEGVSFEFVFEFGRDLGAGKVTEGREDVEVGGQVAQGLGFPLSGPAPKGESPGSAFPSRTLGPAHLGVVDIEPFGHAVVIDHDHDGVFVPPRFLEEVHQAPEVVVDVLDHGQVGRMGFVQPGVAKGLDEFFRAARGVWGE